MADLLTWLTETLSEHVKEVRLSTRLTDSPACLITDAFGITPSLARIYRATGQDVPVGKRTLELNPNQPLITGLQQAHKDRGDDPSNAETADCSRRSSSRQGQRTRGSSAIRRAAGQPVGARYSRGLVPDGFAISCSDKRLCAALLRVGLANASTTPVGIAALHTGKAF